MNPQQHSNKPIFCVKNFLPPTSTYKTEVENKGGNIIFREVIEREMVPKDALKMLRVFRMELQYDQNELKGLEEYIKRKEQHKLLLKKKNEHTKLIKVEKEWTKLIAPAVEDLRKKLKHKVKLGKLDEKYNEHDYNESNQDRKIFDQNHILAKVATELQLDMNDPLMMEVKREFDKI